MTYKIKKNFTGFPSEFYVNVAILHLPKPNKGLIEDFNELPLIQIKLP